MSGEEIKTIKKLKSIYADIEIMEEKLKSVRDTYDSIQWNFKNTHRNKYVIAEDYVGICDGCKEDNKQVYYYEESCDHGGQWCKRCLEYN